MILTILLMIRYRTYVQGTMKINRENQVIQMQVTINCRKITIMVTV